MSAFRAKQLQPLRDVQVSAAPLACRAPQEPHVPAQWCLHRCRAHLYASIFHFDHEMPFDEHGWTIGGAGYLVHADDRLHSPTALVRSDGQ